MKFLVVMLILGAIQVVILAVLYAVDRTGGPDARDFVRVLALLMLVNGAIGAAINLFVGLSIYRAGKAAKEKNL